MTAADQTILILGHRGLVGRALLRAGGDACVHPMGGREVFDLASPDSVHKLIDEIRPGAVINCAAMTAVDACESQPEKAMALNAQGPQAIAQACAKLGAHLIHLSTDFVFGAGHNRPLREDDEPNPLSVYGRTKLEGERLVAEAWHRSLVVRIAWVFGPDKATLVDKMVELVSQGKKVRIVTDQVGSPTYTPDLAPALLALARQRVTSLLHVVNQGQVSRHAQITRAVELAGLDGAMVEPILSSEFDLPAQRPEYSALDTRRFMRISPGGLPTWTDALARHMTGWMEEAT